MFRTGLCSELLQHNMFNVLSSAAQLRKGSVITHSARWTPWKGGKNPSQSPSGHLEPGRIRRVAGKGWEATDTHTCMHAHAHWGMMKEPPASVLPSLWARPEEGHGPGGAA